MKSTARRVKYSSNITAFTGVILVILLLVNYLASNHFVRADLTENKLYTISPSTKKILNEMNDLVNVKVYFSKNLPSYLVNLVNQVQDMLDEYQAYAGGNLRIEWVDPASDEKLEEKVRRMGIPQVQLDVIEKDKRAVSASYLGIALQYKDRSEVIPVVKGIYDLEYLLTSALLKVTKSEPETIGFYFGNDEEAMQEYRSILQEFGAQYQVQPVQIMPGRPIPDTFDTIIVVDPDDVTERDKYELDQFLMNGGSLVFLHDPIEMGTTGLTAEPADSELADLIAHYGIRVGDELVADQINTNASFSSGFMTFSMPYPLWPRVLKTNFTREHPVVSQLESLVFPWTGYVETIDENLADNEPTMLAFSSDRSWLQSAPYDLNPQQRFQPDGETLGSYALAAVVKGNFESFYQGKDIPEPEMPEDEDRPPMPPQEDQETKEESPETYVAVIPNARFISNQFHQMAARSAAFRDNLTFFLNLVDYMTFGEQLIGIRSREITERPLKEISDSSKALVKYANTFGVSLILIIIGLVRSYMKKRERIIYTQRM